jgi:predicted nucleic acid-binding protein
MNRIFADSYFFFAILNSHDTAHAKAIEIGRQRGGPLVTTAWVLTEVSDGLASTARRTVFRHLLRDLEANKVADRLHFFRCHVGGGHHRGADRRPSF